MKRLVIALVVLAAGLMTAPPSPATAAPPAAPRPLKVVQIGDSYSAGNGAGDYYGPKGCYRSSSNWAERYVRFLRDSGHAVTFVNRACSGAVLGNLTRARRMDGIGVLVPTTEGTPPTDPALLAALRARCPSFAYPDEEYNELENVAVRYEPRAGVWVATAECVRHLRAQVDAIGKDTDLVLFTIGGNDIAFADIVTQCFAVGPRDPGGCRNQVRSAVDALPGVGERLVDLLTGLGRDRLRPDAKVVLLAYPYLSNRPSWVLRSIKARYWFGGDSYDAGRGVRELGDQGDAMQSSAVRAAHAATGRSFITYIDTVKAHFAGHEPDPAASNRNPDRWVHEFETKIPAEWYHPNPRGHEEEKNLLIPHRDFGAAPPRAARSGSIDLVFVIDTTGSMQPTLNAVKALTTRMVDLLATSTSSYRFALVTYRDHIAHTGNLSDYPSRVELPFTADTSKIRAALAAMVAGGGGDHPESVYSGLRAGIGLPWRPGVKKVVIQIGDAPPHDPEPVTGYTAADVIAHALSVDPAEVYPVDVAAGRGLGPRMAEIAKGTGGVVTDSTAADVGGDLIKIITSALSKPYAWAGGPYVARIGETVELDASGSFSTSGALAKYEWDLDGDGDYDRTTTGPLLRHVWRAPITGTLGVRVSDTAGRSSVATARLVISRDGDEVADAVDNCPTVANHGQEDRDRDGRGDVCDTEALLPSQDQPGVFEADAPGKLASSVVGGVVFVDGNGDGRRQERESPLSGARIVLTGKDAGGVAVSRSVSSGADGAWSVSRLLPGTYALRLASPAATGVTLGTAIGEAGASAGVIRGRTVTRVILSGVGSTAKGYAFATAAPPPSSPSPSPSPTGGTGSGGGSGTVGSGTPSTDQGPGALGATGAQVGGLLLGGAALVLSGSGLLLAARRRRTEIAD